VWQPINTTIESIIHLQESMGILKSACAQTLGILKIVMRIIGRCIITNVLKRNGERIDDESMASSHCLKYRQTMNLFLSAKVVSRVSGQNRLLLDILARFNNNNLKQQVS
jgi:hypothetical protein